MANLTETAIWEVGVYQWETSDPVQGGPNGIDNKPTRQLANRTLWLKTELAKAVASIGKNKTDAENMFARKSTTVTAGAGLTGGGTLGGNMQFALGSPGTCSGNTTNWAGSDTHTHQLAAASPTVAGVAKLINNLTTDDANSALSAAMGKKLNEEKLGNSGNQTLLNGRFAVQTENNSWAQIAAKGSGDGWIFEVGPEGEGQFTRRRKDAFATHTGNIAVYKLPAGGTGTHVLATESQIGFVKPVIKPAASEIIDLTKRSEILAYAGTSGNKHIQLTFYNNASSQIVGLPIDDKSPCQMDISIMGAYTVCRVYYFYLVREFVASVNWNSEELSYSWRETVNKTNAVMLTGNQNINGAKTFSEILTAGRNNHWGFLRNPVESGGHWVFETNPKSNYADGSTLKVNIKYEQTSGQVRYIHFPELGNSNHIVAYQDWVTAQINAATGAVNDKIANAVPSGAVLHFDLPTAPPGWYELNGAAVPVSACPGLVAARYVGNSANATAEEYYKCTNPSNPSGSRNVNGTHIKLPDRRGEFLRAWDHGRGVDAGRQLGSAQGDAIRNIKGQFQADDEVGVVTRSFGNDLMGAFRSERNHSNGKGHDSNGGGGDIVSFDASRVVPTANENRPRNIALMLCIKA